MQVHGVEHPARHQLAGEVHVPHPKAKQQTHQMVVDERVHKAPGAFAGAVQAIQRHHVGVVHPRHPHGLVQLGQIERQVGVGVQHQVPGGGVETGADGTTQSPVHGMVHHAHALVGGGEGVGDGGGAIGGCVVDDQDLDAAELPGGAQPVTGLQGGDHGAFEAGFLVPGREEDGETVRRGQRCSWCDGTRSAAGDVRWSGSSRR